MDDCFVNLGEEVILTLLWQSAASESATVCMLYLLLTVQMQSFARRVCARSCVRERDRVTSQRSVQPVRNSLNRGLFANTYKHHHHCICHATLFPSRAWTDAKTKDIINCLYFHFESWSSRLWKGALHFRRGLWCSANHNALCQLANQSRLHLSEEGLCRKLSVWERQGIEDLQ